MFGSFSKLVRSGVPPEAQNWLLSALRPRIKAYLFAIDSAKVHRLPVFEMICYTDIAVDYRDFCAATKLDGECRLGRRVASGTSVLTSRSASSGRTAKPA